jgi:hypothetical protein
LSIIFCDIQPSDQVALDLLGKFYLVDAGYEAKPDFLPPFHAARYHLNEWGNNPVQNEELFNHRQSSLHVTVERAIGSVKRRFKILDDATPFFPFKTQVDIVIACCIIYNWVIQYGSDELIIQESKWPIQQHSILIEVSNGSPILSP